MTTSSAGPIFVVGASRSGTALLQAMLNLHPEVHIDGETHYFDDLRARLGPAACAPLSEADDRRSQDYFLALAHRPYGHAGAPEKSPLDRQELKQLAGELGEGSDAYFEAFCRLAGRARGKTRWGEKTPRHVYRIADLLSVYPDARVICMVRDPRAVVASYRNWRNQGGFDFEADPEHRDALRDEEQRTRKSYHPLVISLLWRSTIAAALAAQQQFGSEHVKLLCYEDMVADPEPTVRELSRWLSLDFDPVMLDAPVLNSSFARFDASGGISREAVRRWRKFLSDREISVIQQATGGMMRKIGYDREPVSPAPLFTLWSWLTLPFAALRAINVNGDRMVNLPAYVFRRLRLVVRTGH